jgi:hypothetical protein
VKADQRRLSAERAHDQRDMLLPVVGRSKGHDLSRRHVVERQFCASHDLDGGLPSLSQDVV